MIYSEWEYPLFLWVMGECLRLGVCCDRASAILGRLLKPLNEDCWPKRAVNQTILSSVLSGLAKLNASGLAKPLRIPVYLLHPDRPGESV